MKRSHASSLNHRVKLSSCHRRRLRPVAWLDDDDPPTEDEAPATKDRVGPVEGSTSKVPKEDAERGQDQQRRSLSEVSTTAFGFDDRHGTGTSSSSSTRTEAAAAEEVVEPRAANVHEAIVGSMRCMPEPVLPIRKVVSEAIEARQLELAPAPMLPTRKAVSEAIAARQVELGRFEAALSVVDSLGSLRSLLAEHEARYCSLVAALARRE